MAELKPCPKCGCGVLAKGIPMKITTPKVLRPLMRLVGYTCVRCGYWRHSVRTWNRGAEDGN